MTRRRVPRHGINQEFVSDPLTGQPAELRRIQPDRATKSYRCPGCNQEIPPGIGHVAIIPQSAPEERRHWHRACWDHRGSRKAGR
jgi:hypothetical protein